jgi:glycosyltransferase involved in cell wall biosynthesis
MQVRVLPEYPLGIACGGIELRCLKTVAALNKYKKEDITVKLLDYYNPDDDFDILHLFGNPPSFYEICYHLDKPKKLVISTVLGAHKMPSIKERIAVSFISKMASLAYQRTDNERLKFIFTRANRIICLNDLEKKYLINKFNVTEEKITIVNNAANDNYFAASADLFIEKYRMSDFVLFIGNITKRKNPLILAQILCLLNIKGVFIGHPLGSEINYITKFEQTIKKSPNLLWIKGLDHDDPLLISAYASAKVFCLPSVSETQPQAALEAMSAGTPVIIGDFPYAYQPPFEKSIKVNPADKEALISAIKYAMEQNSSNVSRLPDEYRWNAVAEKINHIYFEVSKK